MTRASLLLLLIASAANAGLPQDRAFYATIKNSSSGTELCLIFGSNGNDTYPSRYGWGSGTGPYCGFDSAAELLANRQAVWLFRPLGNDLYTISQGPCGAEQCLIFGGNGYEAYPSRYDWGALNPYCGFPGGKDALLQNAQAVFRLMSLGGDLYAIWNRSGDGSDRCVIFGGNGYETFPSRYNWGAGNPYCGFPGGLQGLLDNRQGVFRIEEVGRHWSN